MFSGDNGAHTRRDMAASSQWPRKTHLKRDSHRRVGVGRIGVGLAEQHRPAGRQLDHALLRRLFSMTMTCQTGQAAGVFDGTRIRCKLTRDVILPSTWVAYISKTHNYSCSRFLAPLLPQDTLHAWHVWAPDWGTEGASSAGRTGATAHDALSQPQLHCRCCRSRMR